MTGPDTHADTIRAAGKLRDLQIANEADPHIDVLVDALASMREELEWVGALNKANIENGDQLRKELGRERARADRAEAALERFDSFYDRANAIRAEYAISGRPMIDAVVFADRIYGMLKARRRAALSAGSGGRETT